MMRGFLFVILLLPFIASSQDLALRTFVKEDTVQLRWFPSQPELLKNGLMKGYTIVRTDLKSGQEEVFKVVPFKERKENFLNSSDSLISTMTEYVEDYQTISDFNNPGAKMTFGLIMLGASAYADVAKMCGLYFEDLTAKSGNYSYQVVVGDTKSEKVTVNTKKLDKNHEFTELVGISRVDLKEAYLTWEAKELNPWYGGYYIYKSEDKLSFNRLNSLPLYHFTSQYEPDKSIIDYVDTAVVEGKTYYYKVQPINHFGNPGVESNTVEVYIQKRLEGYCIIDTVLSDKFERTIVGFYQGSEEEVVKEFAFFRSDQVDTLFEFIDKKAATDNSFQFSYHTDLLSGDRHYFKVAAISVDGDTVYSYPYYHFSLDQEPPGMPTELAGEVDSAGIARLSWTGSSDRDLQGYRVFRANSLKEEFVEITTFLSMDTIYADTLDLNNLTSEIYYQINAVDLNFNNGPRTEPVKLLKPDTIPPVPSLLRAYKVKEEGVLLEWANSPSDDVTRQYLIRNVQSHADTLMRFLLEHDHYLDTTCLMGIQYTYRLVTLDESDNASEARSMNVVYELGYRPAPKDLTGSADREAKLILLQWRAIMDEIYAVQIYRAKNDGNFRLYKTIRENVSQFEDTDLSINNEYRYKVKIMFKTGMSSKMSEEITVVY